MIGRTTNYQSIRRDDDDRNNQHGIAATTTTATQSNHHVSSSSTVQLRPMGYLTNIERRKRFRFIILMALLCIAIAITLLLWFWFLHVQPRLIDPYVNHDSTYKSRSHDEMQQIADTALFNLNSNYVNGISTGTSSGTKSSSDHIPDHCETTLLVIRHCDKLETNDDDDENGANNGSTSKKENMNRCCSDVGYERAQYITTLFGNTNKSRWPVPNYLYALSSHRDSYENYREYETLLPLSHLISAPIQNVTSTPADALAVEYFFPLLTAGKICGQISVVSWKHHWIPKLVNTLGCGPDNGCPMFYPTDTFDQVWELKFIFRRATHRRQLTTPTMIGGSSSSSSRTDDDSLPSSNAVIVEPSVSSFHVLRKKTKKHHHHHHHHHDGDRSSSFPLDDDHQTNNMTTRDHWIVIGTVTYQMFDPLQYSKLQGHYPTP